MKPADAQAVTPESMLAVALEQARIGYSEGGVPVGGAIFTTNGALLGAGRNRLVQEGNCSLHGETDAFRAAGRRATWHDTILVTTLAPCWYCSGLIYQFRFKQVIVGDSVNAQGGTAWLRRQGIDIVDLHSRECIDLIAEFQRLRPDLWKECIGESRSRIDLPLAPAVLITSAQSIQLTPSSCPERTNSNADSTPAVERKAPAFNSGGKHGKPVLQASQRQRNG